MRDFFFFFVTHKCPNALAGSQSYVNWMSAGLISIRMQWSHPDIHAQIRLTHCCCLAMRSVSGRISWGFWDGSGLNFFPLFWRISQGQCLFHNCWHFWSPHSHSNCNRLMSNCWMWPVLSLSPAELNFPIPRRCYPSLSVNVDQNLRPGQLATSSI